MDVAMIGTGTMGFPMARHLLSKGHQVTTFDASSAAQERAGEAGLGVAPSAAQAASGRQLAIIMVATDQQVIAVCEEMAGAPEPPRVIAVASSTHPDTMRELGRNLAQRSIAVLDAPVVWGVPGALDGTLLTLVGGEAGAVESVRDALKAYSRDVVHMGPLGSGQITKMASNMLIWAISVANFEVLRLVKSLGLAPEAVRKVLLDGPATNNRLEEWHQAYFTWAEKDLDIALDVAQKARAVLPLMGLTDQLVKELSPERIRALME